MSRDGNTSGLKDRDAVETGLKIFRQDFENFFLTCNVGETRIDVHVESLVNLISCAAVEIYNQIESVVEDEQWDNAMDRLEDRYASKQNSIIWQYMFFMRVQEERESFDQFYMGLQEIMANCQFGDAAENLLKTQIALGVNDENTRRRLLERDMDLDYMIMYCQAVELFEKKRLARLSNSADLGCINAPNDEVAANEVANSDGDAYSLSTTSSSNLSLCESNYHEPKEYRLDFSTSSQPDVRKLSRKETVLEFRPIERDNRLPSIEALSDSLVSSRIASTGEDDKTEKYSDNGDETSYLKAISKLKRYSVLSTATDRCNKNNNSEGLLEANIDKDLHVMYQDYRLFNDILDVTMGRVCKHNNNTNTLTRGNRTKSWLLLRNKIVNWLESHNRGLKRNHLTVDGRWIAEDQHSSTTETIKTKSRVVVEELVSTEQSFIDVLTLLCGKFVTSVKAMGDEAIIPPVNLSKIFSPLPQLLKLAEMMSKEMRSRLENWHSDPRIADIIVNKGPFFKLYSTYIQNFGSQTVLLDECCKKYPRFGQCVKDFEASDVCKKLTIKHYMLAPIQRMPRYKLLLNRYLKSLDETSIDYKNAISALDIISDICKRIDKSVGYGDCVNKLVLIQSKLRNDVIIKPGRELIKDGELYKLSRNHTQLRYFILMNDVFYYMSHQSRITGLRIKTKLPLKGMKVVTKNEIEFSIITSTRSFSLMAQSPVSCKEWVASLEASINKYNRMRNFRRVSKLSPGCSSFEQLKFGNLAPVWIQSYSVSQCMLCSVEFTFWIRRHHCRACGKVVCAKCSKNKAPLYYKNFHSVRVCGACFEMSLAEFAKNMPSISQKAYERSDFESVHKLKTIKKSYESAEPSKNLWNVLQRSIQLKPIDTNSVINDWLHQQHPSSETWKKFWFILNRQTLFVYKAPEEISPILMINVYGYKVERYNEDTPFDNSVFQLASNSLCGMITLVLRADNKEIADKWVNALNEAANLTV